MTPQTQQYAGNDANSPWNRSYPHFSSSFRRICSKSWFSTESRLKSFWKKLQSLRTRSKRPKMIHLSVNLSKKHQTHQEKSLQGQSMFMIDQKTWNSKDSLILEIWNKSVRIKWIWSTKAPHIVAFREAKPPRFLSCPSWPDPKLYFYMKFENINFQNLRWWCVNTSSERLSTLQVNVLSTPNHSQHFSDSKSCKIKSR